jgi:4'-phosphopantetheinyl transferase EntD
MLTPAKLRPLAGDRIGIGIRYAPNADEPLPEEIAGRGGDVPEARRLEFALGRSAARDAFIDADLPPSPVRVGPAGEPVWPDGIVGSIAHCAGLAIAMAGRREDWAGIGVDVEPEGRRAAGRTARRICTAAEIRWIEASVDPERRTILVFCSKEAIYKALALTDRTALGFHEVEFAPARSDLLEGRILGDVVPSAPRRFEARTLVEDGFVVSCVVLPART